jgi:hypothetical protein
MKKFKELKQRLFESENTEGGALGGFPVQQSVRSAQSDYGVHRIEAEQQLQRIQAFLTAFTGREYLDPRSALSLMRVKLNLTGLDFDFNNKTDLPVGQPINFQLKRFGGTWGTTPTHDLANGFKETDGVEDTLGGDHLGIVVMIAPADSGLYQINAQIQRYSDGQDMQSGDEVEADQIEKEGGNPQK